MKKWQRNKTLSMMSPTVSTWNWSLQWIK